MMTAGFERDIGRSTIGITSIVQGHDFGMRLPGGLCKTGTDLLIIAN